MKRGAFLLACLVWAQTATAVQYRVYDLGVLPREPNSVAYGLNNNGMVVGISSTGGYAFRWTAQTGMRRIALSTHIDYKSTAVAVNDFGVICGTIDFPPPGQRGRVDRAFVQYVWPFYTQLGSMDDFQSRAWDINNAGQVCGSSDLDAFLYTPGQGMRALGRLPGGLNATALGLNNLGTVVGEGEVQIGLGHVHPFVWKPSTGMVDIQPLPLYDDGYAADVDDHGTVLVRHFTFGQPDTISLWTEAGGHVNLGWPAGSGGAFPLGLNNNGQVVGAAYYGVSRAFLWTRESGYVLLNDVLDSQSQGWDLRTARKINNRGEICGGGFHNGLPRAYLAVPAQ
ncbi:MAG: hypothetical protein JNM34_11925 [Chthonomonadaceae bacterium]|nr:hypothetical protein [Chthonomonadaceae bacterium]